MCTRRPSTCWTCGRWAKRTLGHRQIVPKRSIELSNAPKAPQAWPALMQIKKIDIGTFDVAAEAP